MSLVPIVRWSSSIRVDGVHRSGVVMLVFVVTRFWGLHLVLRFSTVQAYESVESQAY
jgi:hypothetical protein